MLVIADLLGVPEEDHDEFRDRARRAATGRASSARSTTTNWSEPTRSSGSTRSSSHYLEDRRENPRDDVLTALATAQVPRRLHTAGRSTWCARDLPVRARARRPPPSCCRASMRVLGDRPDIQEPLRKDRSRIPIFVEESLRMDAPVKSQFRLATQEHHAGRHRRARRHDGDGVPRCGQPRSRSGSRTRTSSASTARTSASTSPSAAACTPAPAARSPASKVGCRSNASSTGWPTSRSTRRSTARQAQRELQLRADVHPARADRDQHQVHARRVGRRSEDRRELASQSRRAPRTRPRR